ncbi:microtubule-associated protein Jupiter isoform X2 [Anopheles moucheti]|uniref:microtubule-associated protein Jupiter isoform X2 n=1 Tax=Anopheles moucheti TaxID=186751 RepID=UPI0022F0030F|nr:microtubule-associated protein Jupiter isoform X2 [Anopheles moucheti]
MTSTNFTVGFGENSKASSKVLKPPGGGSSDLFGADQLGPNTPRTMSKNRMQSNIFTAPSDAHKNGSETPRRNGQGQDSHNRLFGELNRPFTPAKNHMKSNLPIGNPAGGDHTDGGKPHQNGKSNGVAHQNGNGTANGHHTNGHSNGNGHISSASSDNGSSHSNEEDASPDSAYSSTRSHTQQQQQNMQSMAGPGGIWAPFDTAAGMMPPLSPRRQLQFYPSGETLNPTYASNINLCISDDIIISVTEHDDTVVPHGLNSNNGKASPRSPRSPRFAQRNPVTGNGVEDYADKPRKLSSRRGAGDGNPVTGEGYSKSNGAAEINTTVPSLNGGGHVINKNRIPPGGFSSGLW